MKPTFLAHVFGQIHMIGHKKRSQSERQLGVWAPWLEIGIAALPPVTSGHSSMPTWAAKSGTWVCLKMLCTPKPNGFADHYPYEKWLFHWEYTQHFQTKPLDSLDFRWNFLMLAESGLWLFQTSSGLEKAPE